MKKLLLYVAILLLTSCTKQTDTAIDVEEPITEPIEAENDETETVRYTGEIISDGYFGDKGRIYFVPDKETRELLKNEYPYSIDAGESIPLDYDGIYIVKDLPQELEDSMGYTVECMRKSLSELGVIIVDTIEYYDTKNMPIASNDKIKELVKTINY